MALIIMIYKLLSLAQRTIFWHFVCVSKTKNSNVNQIKIPYTGTCKTVC